MAGRGRHFLGHSWVPFFIFTWCSRTVPGSIPGGVNWGLFRGSFRQTHVPWGRLSLWKRVPGISHGVKAAGAFGWRPTTHVVPKVEKIRGLNLPGTPRATSVCRGIPLLYFFTRVGVQHHAPAALPPGKTQYPLYRRLGGPQSQSGQ